MSSNLRRSREEQREKQNNDLHDLLHHTIEHFAHVLPAQASIRDFVHHNTLHGYQELKFQDALKASCELTGAYGYWPQDKFLKAYLADRITDSDIFQVLSKDKSLESDMLLLDTGDKKIYLRDVYKIACLYPLKKITSCQLKWQIEEADALGKFQSDIADTSKKLLLDASTESEQQSIEDLWAACIDVLELDHALLHPEELLNLEVEQIDKIFSKTLQQHQSDSSSSLELESDLVDNNKLNVDTLIEKQARKQMDELLSKVGNEVTMGGLLKKITGIDIQREITAHLLPYLGNWLDEGFAQWHASSNTVDSFYQNWKQSATIDETGLFSDIPDWKEHIDSLPSNAIDTVVAELRRMSIPQSRWGDYITRLALELPGWSGMFYWRHTKPEYSKDTDMQVDMMDYLAVRLVLEHIYVRKYCRRNWLVGGDLAALSGYLHQHYAEFFVRNALFNQMLPEYLKTLVQKLIPLNAQRETLTMHEPEWQQLAHMIWTWQQSPVADISLTLQADRGSLIEGHLKDHRGAHYHHDGWKLFRLVQHLGLCAKDIRVLDKSQLDDIFHGIKRMDKQSAGFILLQAYELHYQNRLFTTITLNHGRGTWKNRKKQTPEAQVFFCMDDREEGIRRHLEHSNPNIETFGSAAFFNVVLGWKALESEEVVSLCPVVFNPVHEIKEVADPAHIDKVKKYNQKFKQVSSLRNQVHQNTHQGLLSTSVLLPLFAPAALLTLIGKVFLPYEWNKKLSGFSQSFKSKKITRIETTASQTKQDACIDDKQQGFTIIEQVDIVERFLQDNGLLSGFSSLIVIMGHYSRNQNNPHTAAYGCGACGGKFSGPNGRVFAAMANHPEVRQGLQERNIKLPETTWFIGAEHDTCNENMVLYDKDLIPESLHQSFEKLKVELNEACQHSAQERCRKLASAPKNPSLINALKHIAGRAVDISQARPELGHATIAAGFVGRRYFSQGTFMDRRSFLISYDANVDPEGKFLERLLLSVGPVGAGINLEYYFSSVNNEYYGSGSKIVHNLSGIFGVMEGASGDLRTGLPVQMIEIHEPMRLQLMIEAKIEVLTKIYQDQPSIQQLVGNGWLILSAKDPDSEVIQTFDPVKGWQIWKCPETNIPTVKSSEEWYRDQYDHLPPVLIETQNSIVSSYEKSEVKHA